MPFKIENGYKYWWYLSLHQLSQPIHICCHNAMAMTVRSFVGIQKKECWMFLKSCPDRKYCVTIQKIVFIQQYAESGRPR